MSQRKRLTSQIAAFEKVEKVNIRTLDNGFHYLSVQFNSPMLFASLFDEIRKMAEARNFELLDIDSTFITDSEYEKVCVLTFTCPVGK